MASSSTSSSQKSFKYDVFASFRGEDTRKNFVDHLYHALERKSIHTYKDDERITKGKKITDELIRSIEESKFYVIVFSKNYASSSWCLDELVKIMECQKTSDQTAYPVFYDVEPTEIRKQSGSVGEAFAKLEKHEAAGKWREAMKEAADLAGWELKNTLDGHEARFIQKIVEEISLELRFIDSSVDGKLIGMESRVKGLVSALETDYDDVRMIGIKGMGGGGKTSLARAVFDQISNQFEGQSFLENVREVSKASFSGLKKLQKKVLSDVLNDEKIKIRDAHEGKRMMRQMMCGRKVLVVLDDVDCIDQLEALAGEPTWFKPGSRIIITTRDEQVLVAHRVNLISDINLLSDKEAICLFSKYAFGKVIPIQGYEELSGNVVHYAAGLPLTIKVLGSFLCGKTHLEWKDAIDRLKTIPLRETLEKLELSYIGLEEDYKEIFLDVACILKGWEKEKAVEVLESCGFHARNGLRVLEQRSLITVSGYGSRLGMHDHIEEMGKNIVRRLHPNEPWMHSRLWIQEEIEDILTNELGTEATRCIKILMTGNDRLETFMRGFGKMKELRVVDIFGYNFSAVEVLSGQCFPHALRYLRWNGCPFEYLMKSFQADHLVGLSLHVRKIIQFWECGERKVLRKLRFLDIRYSDLRTLDLEMTPNIETLSLEGCDDLLELHMPFGCPKLKSLSLDSAKLRTLNLGSTPDLETLSLKGCDKLLELHMPFQCPKLKSLSVNFSKLRTLNLGSTTDLETLSLEECDNLVELYMPFECSKLKAINFINLALKNLNLEMAPNIKTLSLDKCRDLLELNLPFQCSRLKGLNLKSCTTLRTLKLAPTPNLETLSLVQCRHLVELNMPFGCPKLKALNLESCEMLRTLNMPFGCPKLKSFNLNNSVLKNLNLGSSPDLETLSLEGCDDLLELHMPFRCPKLKSLSLDCVKLRTLNLGSTPDLETLSLEGCDDLLELHMPFRCPKLKSLSLDCLKLRTLNLGSTPDLETLSLKRCHDLLELHMPNECPNLKYLSVNSSNLRTLNLGQTSDLEILRLNKCHDLEELHMPNGCPNLKSLVLENSNVRKVNLGLTPDLEYLTLQGCHDLSEFHFPFQCPKLKSFRLYCSKLRTLDLRLTSDLEALSLEECRELVELHMPNESPKLKYLNLKNSALRNLNLRSTPDLETLSLEGCHDLVELHKPFRCPKLKVLRLEGSKLRTLYHVLTPDLETLSLGGCCQLLELHMPNECPKLKSPSLNNSQLKSLILRAPIGCLEKLVYLDDYAGFKRFSIYKQIQSPVGSLYVIAESIDTCPMHSDSNFPKFRFSCLYGQPISSSIGNLRKLISVGLCPFTNLESFSESICNLQGLRKLTLEGSIPEVPKDLDQLQSLEELSLLSTTIKHLPDSICMLKNLKLLELNSCWFLEKLPEGLGRLECLEDLNVTSCIHLQDIPKSICDMKRLKCFNLSSCLQVKNLPRELRRLKCLKELNIKDTGISDLPDGIFELEGLHIVASDGLSFTV